MKIKIIEALKKNKEIQISLALTIIMYSVFFMYEKFIFIYILTLFCFLYRLIRVYYNNLTDILEYSILVFADITYTLLDSFDIKYILMYIIMCLFCVYIDSKKINNNDNIYLVIEFITIYTFFKIILFLSMILYR